jgi:MurNAc alpha-1-phosphate uridylyltransferase
MNNTANNTDTIQQEHSPSIEMRDIRAMILAAGLGTRLKPWTDKHPKALAIVNGKSLLQRNVEYLQSFGITHVVVNVHHFAGQVIEAIESSKGWGSNITISDEKEEVLETGGGLVKAARYLAGDAPFVLMNADVLTDMDLLKMIRYHMEHHPLATLATSNRETSRYFLFDADDNLRGWRNTKTGEEKHGLAASQNTPAPATFQRAFSGIHVIDPKIFSLITHQNKFSMVDVYLDFMQHHTIKSFDHSTTHFIDVGKPESIARAELMFQ